MDGTGWIVLGIFLLWLWGRASRMNASHPANTVGVVGTPPANASGPSSGDNFNSCGQTIVAGVCQPIQKIANVSCTPQIHLQYPIDVPPPLSLIKSPIVYASTPAERSPAQPAPTVSLSPVNRMPRYGHCL